MEAWEDWLDVSFIFAYIVKDPSKLAFVAIVWKWMVMKMAKAR